MPNTNKPQIITFDDFKANKDLSVYKGQFDINLSPNFVYLGEYLDRLDCTHCVIEPEYISISYWYDYSSYYANQTSDYSKFTKRIHFFNAKEFANKFTNFDTFHEHLISDKFKNEETPYLGYAVIKDLPDPRSAVGVMLLATYPSKSRDTDNALKLRHHPCTKKYEVNIFGKKLVIDSLVTQSQTGVSACASTALFSAIHLLSDIYTTDKLFPAQITKLAYRKYPNQQRAFPNRLGLDTIQVVGVLRELRLAHELVTFNPKSPTYKKPENISSKDYFKALLYAYNECSIPVLVMIDRFDYMPETNDQQGGLHLVVSAGYRIDYDRKSNSTQIKLFSDKIDKHFFMDDNRGAFTAVKPNEDAIWDLETLGKDRANA
jgi:hypothetical protein